jgi:cytochrome b561
VATAIFSDQSPRYDSRTVWLHWITAIIVLTLWCLGQTIDWFPRGNPRVLVRSTHIGLGAGLALVLCYRLWWRSSSGRRLPKVGSAVAQAASTLVHWGLYGLLLGAVVLGIANVWMRGDNIFNWFSVPAFDRSNKILRGRIEDLHAWFANGLLILAGLHAFAALVHQFILKDTTLHRMLPWRK